MTRRTKPKFKIIEEDLTDDDDWGQTNPVGNNRFEIIIDSKHRSERERLDTVIHEAIHVADFNMAESKVKRIAEIVADALWRQNYRRRK